MTENRVSSLAIKVIAKTHLTIQVYLFITEMAFFFGPWDWWIPNLPRLLFFFAAIHFMILSSYLIARAKTVREWELGTVYSHDLSNSGFLKAIIAVSLLLAIPTSISRTGSAIPDIFNGLGDLGKAYNANYERISSGNPFAFIEYIRIGLSPLLIGIVSVVAFFWSTMKLFLKIMAVIAIVFTALTYIAIGTNKGVADLVILAPIFAHLSKALKNKNHRFVLNKINLLGLSVFVIFLIFFGQTQELRAGNVGSGGIFNTGAYIIVSDSSRLPDWVNNQWVIIYESITRYLTQGYQALALALDVDHPLTLGVGNSMFLTENAGKLFGTQFFELNNLPAVLESRFGWSRFFLWHSAYVWFMSDLGYFGTIGAIGVFAHVLFRSIVRMLSDPNVISIILVQQMIVLFLYLPANNQVFQNGEGLVGTIIVMIMSLIYTRSSPARSSVQSSAHHAAARQSL